MRSLCSTTCCTLFLGVWMGGCSGVPLWTSEDAPQSPELATPGSAATDAGVMPMADLALPDLQTPSPGESCESAEADGVLASGQREPRELTIDDTAVYWLNHGVEVFSTGQVMRIAKSGGAATVLADNQSVPLSLTADATSVYWVNGGIETGKGQVRKVAKTGGSIEILADGLDYPRNLTADADFLYWTSPYRSDVRRVSKRGGPVTVIYKLPGSSGLSGIANDAGNVYIATGVNDDILSIPKLGGPVTTVGRPSACQIEEIAVDGTDLYFVCHRDGSLRHLDLVSGTISTLLSHQYNLHYIALDKRRVYVTRYGSTGPVQPGGILSVPRGGGAMTTAAEGGRGHWGLAVDCASVYFSNQTDLTVNVIRK